MEYKVFKEVAKESIRDYLPEKFAHYDVDVKPVHKVNGTLDGLFITEAGKQEMTVAPIVYLQELYEEYKSTGNLETTLAAAASRLVEGLEHARDMAGMDFSEPETKLVLSLINTEQNQELLQDIPNRPFQDLSIVCRYIAGMDKEGVSSVLVSNRIMEGMGLSKEQLFQMAEENTKQRMPPQVMDMAGILKGILVKEGMPEELADTMLEGMPAGFPMYVLTNSSQVNGAVSVVFDDTLHTLAEGLGQDLYLLPSSIHEVIAVPVDVGTPEELAQMVEEVNLTQVSLKERLSNQVYHYDREQHKLSMAVSTPAKHLDGTVPENHKKQEKKQK